MNDAPLTQFKGEEDVPSPAVFEVDGDGSKELVIGDLMGGVGVYANLNTGVGEPVWGPRNPLDDSKGAPIAGFMRIQSIDVRLHHGKGRLRRRHHV